MKDRPRLILLVLFCLLAAVGWWRLCVGPEPSDPHTLSQIMGIRRGHLFAGLLVGGSLALAGVLLQGLLRNPLASPDIMGLASGAGLAVMLANYAGCRLGAGAFPASGPLVPAMIGAFASLTLVYALSQRRGVIDPVSMVLVGVIISITTAAGTMLVQLLLPDRGLLTARWLFGGIDEEATPWRLGGCAAVFAVVALAGQSLSTVFDAAMMSEDEARSVGIRLGVVRAFQFAGAGALTGGAVALAGPIGFVGLIAPHVARGLVGPGHRWAQPAAVLVGAILVVAADASIRMFAVSSGRVPLGVLTALLGGPFFLGVLLQNRRKDSA